MATNTQDFKRVTFTGVTGSGWIGAKAGSFNVLVDGVDSTSIDDDAYFFYNTFEAQRAIDILTKQGLLGPSVGIIPTIVDIPTYSFGAATPTNIRWYLFVNGFMAPAVGAGGGLYLTTQLVSQAKVFHDFDELLEAETILINQGVIKRGVDVLTRATFFITVP